MSGNRKKIGLLLGLGFLTWLVPFVGSWPFYSSTGEPLIDIFLLKSIMIVVFGSFGAVCLIFWFREIDRNYLREGITVGFVWLIINWILDILILLPMADMDIKTYFGQIGLRYLMIPVMAIAIGYSVDRAVLSK